MRFLAGVYTSAEVFQSQDTSPDFKETEKFVDRRLQDVLTVGGAAGAVTEWLGYTAISAVNVARSLGVRI
jgi:ubiquinone biosynthesis protein COQ9